MKRFFLFLIPFCIQHTLPGLTVYQWMNSLKNWLTLSMKPHLYPLQYIHFATMKTYPCLQTLIFKAHQLLLPLLHSPNPQTTLSPRAILLFLPGTYPVTLTHPKSSLTDNVPLLPGVAVLILNLTGKQ